MRKIAKKLEGWKTFGLSALVTLVGLMSVLQIPEVKAVINEKTYGYAILAIGVLIAIFRGLTYTASVVNMDTVKGLFVKIFPSTKDEDGKKD